MKVQFSKVNKFYPNWGGNDSLPDAEKFWTIIRPMDNIDLLTLQDMVKTEDGDNTSKVKSIANVASKYLGKYVELHNLDSGDGPVAIDDVANHMFYIDLVIELINKIMEVSTPTKSDEKN